MVSGLLSMVADGKEAKAVKLATMQPSQGSFPERAQHAGELEGTTSPRDQALHKS